MKKLLVILVAAIASISIATSISGVKLIGLKQISEKKVLEEIGDWRGYPLSSDVLSKIAKAIMDTGYFSNVRFSDVEFHDDEATVVYEVKENPILKKWDLKVDGPQLLKISDISSEVTLREGTILNFRVLQESIQNIVKAYREAGYVLVEVKPELGQGTLTINVIEYGVWDIEFEGLEGIDATSLKNEMGFQTLRDYYSKCWLIRLFMDKKKSYPKIADIQKMMATLSKKVYFKDARVYPKKIEKKEGIDDNLVDLVFKVEMRRVVDHPVEVKKVELRGVSLIDKGEVLGILKDVEGEKLGNVDILKKAQDIVDLYEKKGYLMVWVDPKYENGTLVFNVKEKRIKRVLYEFISGDGKCKVIYDAQSDVPLQKTCDFKHTRKILVDDLVGVSVGDPLEKNLIGQTIGALQRARYFDSVNAYPSGTRDATQVDLIISMKEKEKRFMFMGGGGIGKPPEGEPWWKGLTAQLQLSTVNPFGMGQSVSLSLNLGFTKSSINLDYSIPRPFDIPVKWGIGGSLSYIQIGEFTGFDWSLRTSLSTLPFFGNTFTVGIGYERTPSNDNALNLSFSHAFDNTDAAFMPKKGLRISESVTRGGLISTSKDYLKIEGNGSLYIPVIWNFYVVGRGYAGKIWNYLGDTTIIPDMRNTVRGFRLEGFEIFRGSAEFHWRIYSDVVPLDALLFYDAGMVDGTVVQKVGIGLEVAIPIFGEVEIGMAWNVETWSSGFYWVIGLPFAP